MSDPMEQAARVAEQDFEEQVHGQRRGEVSTFTCPECGGSLWQVDDDKLVRFRCHVGHAYYGDTLLSEQSEALEAALWTAVRSFRERAVLARQLAGRERARGHEDSACRFDDQAEVSERYDTLIREYLLQTPPPGTSPPPGAPSDVADLPKA